MPSTSAFIASPPHPGPYSPNHSVSVSSALSTSSSSNTSFTPERPMAASIPIPGAHHTDDQFDSSIMYEYHPSIGGISLPAARHFQSQPVSSPPASTYTSRDDIATSWPPRPSVRLVSRSARRFAHDRRSTAQAGSTSRSRFEPWDFSQVAEATDQVQNAFLRGSARAERPPREGVSGTYFIRRVESKNSVLGVFKPVDEEAGEIERSPPILQPLAGMGGCGESPFTLGSHHAVSSMSPIDSSLSPAASPIAGFSSFSSRIQGETAGFKAGEGALKEVAAYILDHDHFARVPQTALATCTFESDLPEKNKSVSGSMASSHSSSYSASIAMDPFIMPSDSNDGKFRTKTGAFQVYVSNVGDADDFGPGVFDRDQVHSLAIFDLRTLNHDRHSGNILVSEKPPSNGNGRYTLTPIDHGYILPAVVRNVPWPVWMDWSVVREPLSSESRAYVARLDAASEGRILNEELDGRIRPESLRILSIATALLQKGVAAGLTLYDIGRLVYSRRECPQERSELEKIVQEAEEAGMARKWHMETEHSSPCEEYDSYDRLPYKSSGNLPSLAHVRSDTDLHIDDFVVRYAAKRINDLVRDLVAKKQATPVAPAVSTMRTGMRGGNIVGGTDTPFVGLGRARSIPDFGGLGYRPLQAMFNSAGSTAPTPASSPTPSRKPSLRSNDEVIQFSIDSAMRSIPIPKASDNQPKPTRTQSMRSRRAPRHRRNASDRGMLEKVGSLEAPALEINAVGRPPLFKGTRKASPLGPFDVTSFWSDNSNSGNT